jgi:hypothetical protein
MRFYFLPQRSVRRDNSLFCFPLRGRKAKNKSASGRYHTGYKPNLLAAILVTLVTALIILKKYFIYNPQG